MNREVNNNQDIIDSRDIIKRIEKLQDIEERDDDENAELKTLLKVQEEGESSPDWTYGETLIRETYFEEYITELIHDCYPMPKEMNSGEWPWRHIKIDYRAAADEAEMDYTSIDFDGVNYFIRS